MKKIFLFLFIALNVSAQQSMDLTLQSGKVVKNYPRFPERDLSKVARFSWNKKLSGGDSWHYNYRFPELTVQATAGDLGNRDVLGYIYGLTGGLRFSKDVNERWTLTAEGCFGAAYFNNPFDEANNFDNVTVGSSFTALATADFGAMYHLHPYWSLVGKASILHCSNAHIGLPNVGINMPMLSLGIRYRFKPALVVSQQQEAIEKDIKPKFNFRIALGLNEQGGATGPVNGPRYSVYLASAYIYRHYTPVARWQTGLEAYYNNGVRDFILSQQYYNEKENLKSSSVIYMLGHEYILGHVSMVTQGGLYLYNPFARDRYKEIGETTKDFLRAWFTARLGFQYYLFDTYHVKHKNFFVGWYVKTNFGKADFMEMSIGYNF